MFFIPIKVVLHKVQRLATLTGFISSKKSTANIGDSGGLIQHGLMHMLSHAAPWGLVHHYLVHQGNEHFGDLKHFALVP